MNDFLALKILALVQLGFSYETAYEFVESIWSASLGGGSFKELFPKLTPVEKPVFTIDEDF